MAHAETSVRPSQPTNPVFEELRRQQQGFSEVAAWSRTSFNLADGGEIRLARGVMVSGGYFGMLGSRRRPAACSGIRTTLSAARRGRFLRLLAARVRRRSATPSAEA